MSAQVEAHAPTLRPVRPGDEPFLFAVYAGTRTEELAVVPWSEDEKLAFLRMQFAAQHQHYQERFAGAEFHVIECDGEPVGRFYVHRGASEIRIVDIALLPAYRGMGIGHILVRAILREAAATERVVRIHVEQMNPARAFYDRLGFTVIGGVGLYVLMEWRPSRIALPDPRESGPGCARPANLS